MGKKKRSHTSVEELLDRPWCYYCERDFEDLKLLISHQKAKHFKCEKCGRRLNTAGGLSVHMNQVHKESLSQVENALPNRQGLDVEIFGMEGVPDEVVQQHKQRIVQNFYQAQADRFAATGNPPPGQGGKRKKIKIESPEELKKRLAEFVRLRHANGGVIPPRDGVPDGRTSSQGGSPATFSSPYPPPGGAQFPGYPQPPNLPSRTGSNGTPTGLPARPGQAGWQAPGNASTIDELVSGAAGQPPKPSDDIDEIIRKAEAGIKADEPQAEKKSKKDKDKNVRMVYDDELSPEERMAQMSRYAFVPEVGA